MTLRNRSAPPHAVVPILVYDGEHAVEWLTRTFVFVEKVRISDHRAQLDAGGEAVIVADATHGRRAPAGEEGDTHSTMVRVQNIGTQYSARDPAVPPVDLQRVRG
ncbi:MAG: hypothetical protein M3Y17_06660 [Actinomycetota bacterium]|nr:hypothetical protein [Actinomycetota bacterium]